MTLAPTPPLSARLLPRGASRREMAALETMMARLSLDARHPIALEVMGDARGVAFLIRASDPDGFTHLCQQAQALYPQAVIEPLAADADPLRLERGEALTVVELIGHGPPYLSLRLLDERNWRSREAVGNDPLLGVLGAMQGFPHGVRAIAQVALVPASPRWSRPHVRKAVEHPLEPEREAARNRMGKSSNAPSWGAIVALAVMVVLAFIWRRFGAHLSPLLPAWGKQDVLLLLHGHLPSLTAHQIIQLAVVAVIVFLIVFGLSRLWNRIQRNEPLYEMRQVGEKTKRVAYRARLRLYIIGPASAPILPRNDSRARRVLARCWQIPQWCARHLAQRLSWLAASPRHSAGKMAFSRWQAALKRFMQAVQRVRARRTYACSRRAIASRLAAAYRQCNNPAGTILLPRQRRLRAAHLLARFPSPLTIRRAHRLVRIMRLRIPALKGASSVRRRWFFTRCAWRWLARTILRILLGRATWMRGLSHAPLYLSVAEVAMLWHLVEEQDAPDVAGLERGRARSRPLPPQLLMMGQHGLLPYHLGECWHAGQQWPVFVPKDVLHQNSLAVAATGKGKSTLFSHLALAHLAGNPGDGLFFMEPHGDTIAALLGGIPESRCEEMTLIDLADETASIGLNPLDMTQGRSRDKTVDNILAVFIAFWKKQRAWGPRTENILQFALLALTEANLRRLDSLGDDLGAEGQYTLLDVIPLLQKSAFRGKVLEEVRDPVIRDWFLSYYNPLRQSFRDEMISSIINKISKYAAAQVSRRILGQSRATVRLSDDIQAGRVILVNTAAGIVGEEVSALVGATLVGLFQTALAEQIRLPSEKRRRFWVVIDEFQTYLGINYNAMLAELRKYGGAFALATQSLAYLDEVDRSLKPTVLSNSDQLFAFAMSSDDAKALTPSLDGLEVGDLVSLDAYTCYARLTIGGRRLPPFSLHVAEPPDRDPAVAAALRRRSNERNTRAIALVDDEGAPEPSTGETAGEGRANDAETTGKPGRRGAEGKEAEAERQRGKRGGKGNRSHAESERTPRLADGTPLTQPYVTDTARVQPRTSVWSQEDPEREESGEMRGE